MTFSNQPAENCYKQFDRFINGLMPDAIDLQIECESQTAINSPGLRIKFNDIIVYDQKLTDGVHNISVTMTPNNKQSQVLSISMYGKTNRDTIVENGVIIKDTNIKLSKININNYSLLDDYDFFNENFLYVNEDKEQAPMTGFWSNSRLELQFDNPFELWYNSVSKKNVLISSMMRHRAAHNLDELVVDLEASLKKLV